MERIKNWFKKDHSTLIVWGLLTVIVILATFLDFYHIGKLSLWNDEIDTVIFVTRPLKGLFQLVWKSYPNMALYYLFAHYWVYIFPHASEGVLRALSAIFAIAGIPVVFLLGRTLGVNRKKAAAVGLIAAFLVAINAFNIQYAQEFRSYSLVFFLSSLSTLFLIKAIEQSRSKHYWVLYTIVSAAAVYSHFYVVFLIMAQVVTLPVLLLERKKDALPIRNIIFSCAAIILLIFPIALAAHTAGASQLSWILKLTLMEIWHLLSTR